MLYQRNSNRRILCRRISRSTLWKCEWLKNKKYYRAKIAQDEYEKSLSESRIGINLSKDQVYEINSLLNSLIINKHQSLNHVFINNKSFLNFSKKSLYNYINLGIFDVKNIDLQRKVKYKPRKNNEKNRTKLNNSIRIGRTYQDFLNYISNSRNGYC